MKSGAKLNYNTSIPWVGSHLRILVGDFAPLIINNSDTLMPRAEAYLRSNNAVLLLLLLVVVVTRKADRARPGQPPDRLLHSQLHMNTSGTCIGK